MCPPVSVTEAEVIDAVAHWVATCVVGLNLCPFAKREVVKQRVRYVVSQDTNEQALLVSLQAELDYLTAHPEVETTLLITIGLLQDFYDYNDFLDQADYLLQVLDLEGVYQIASFHPDYQFGGTLAADVENYTNRSPYPVLHLLREESLEQAIADYPDVEQIPERNIALMQQLGVEQLTALLAACRKQG